MIDHVIVLKNTKNLSVEVSHETDTMNRQRENIPQRKRIRIDLKKGRGQGKERDLENGERGLPLVQEVLVNDENPEVNPLNQNVNQINRLPLNQN